MVYSIGILRNKQHELRAELNRINLLDGQSIGEYEFIQADKINLENQIKKIELAIKVLLKYYNYEKSISLMEFK